jgi:hypothetical protein
LSKQISEQKIRNYVDTLDKLIARARASHFASRDEPLKRTLYGVARFAFRTGHRAVGVRALQLLRSHGCDKHFGSRMHRAVSTVIGLEAKVRLFESAVARERTGSLTLALDTESLGAENRKGALAARVRSKISHC